MSNKKFSGEYISVSLAITAKYGLRASAIYGIVWSREQLSKGYCFESYETIGKLTGCSVRQVSREIKTLLQAGLIKDVSGFQSLEAKKLGMAKRLVTVPEVLEKLNSEYDTSANLAEGTDEPMPNLHEGMTDWQRGYDNLAEGVGQIGRVDNKNNKEIINNNTTDSSFDEIKTLKNKIKSSFQQLNKENKFSEFTEWCRENTYSFAYKDIDDVDDLKSLIKILDSFNSGEKEKDDFYRNCPQIEKANDKECVPMPDFIKNKEFLEAIN